MRRCLLVLVATLFVCYFATAQNGGNRGPSTPEEREEFIAIAHKLEQSPLDKSLRKEREWALLWLIQVPDVHVNICTTPLGDFMDSKYKYSAEIVGQMTFSSGVFAIEHLGKPADDAAQYLAGVEGALNAYQAILKSKPEAKSKALDGLLEKQNRGQLADFVRDASSKGCNNNKKS
jgi:hypothetical protein